MKIPNISSLEYHEYYASDILVGAWRARLKRRGSRVARGRVATQLSVGIIGAFCEASAVLVRVGTHFSTCLTYPWVGGMGSGKH
jgi:hypothetical protein